MEKTWISSTIWPTANWSVFGQTVRKNNDCEGWHTRLRVRGKPNMPFYLLTTVLHQEADTVSLTMRLISENKMNRLQRKKYRDLQGKLFLEWDKYSTALSN